MISELGIVIGDGIEEVVEVIAGLDVHLDYINHEIQ